MRNVWLLALYLMVLSAFAQSIPENIARIHYQRPDKTYDGFELHVWEDTTNEVTWADGLDIAGQDDYGVYWDVNLKENALRVGFIVHRGDEKDPGPDMFLVLSQHGNEIWLSSGSDQIFTLPPLGPPAEDSARIHYYRPDGNYEGFELHVWEDADETVSWQDGLDIAGQTDYGVYWTVKLKENAKRVGFIVHKGDEKDPGADMFLELDTMGNEVWLISGSDDIYSQRLDIKTVASGDLGKARAHWVRPDLILWDIGTVLPGSEFWLHASAGADLELSENGISGGEAFALTPWEAIPDHVLQDFPHLSSYTPLVLQEEDAARAKELLKGQVAVSMMLQGKTLDATGLQIPGVIDTLYASAYHQPLGPSWQHSIPILAVFAPMASQVKVHLFNDPDDQNADQVLNMQYDNDTGIWSVRGDPGWKGKYYLFEVTVYAPSTQNIETNLVTDPYSIGLNLNSTKSQLIDLEDPRLKPEGWDTLIKSLPAPEDMVIYEMHLRDFSMNDDSIPTEHRGTYLAFTHTQSKGMKHLKAIAEAGLTHVHLLPTFDIATINEDKGTWKSPEDLSVYPADSLRQQEIIEAIRDQDGFNWGYDPFHYNVPEGSYAVNADLRTLEYRQMIKALSEIGLYVVADVVYNHTHASGQQEKSVLDKIVPGYYHRLNADGYVETSTCCQNTATEHLMMEKLMVDSVLLWAKHYKIDAFRFDLMGHHMVRNMQAVRAALDALSKEKDGVDGKGIYLYGEGWNFGEVANNARGQNATQINMAGTGIGTFSDRLRDAVRGGGPFDSGLDLITKQGFVSGRYSMPNAHVTETPEQQLEILLTQADQIRVGLAGNLAEYTLIDKNGRLVSGKDIDYNGSPAGYTQQPQEHIVYISKHDNQTFWDFNQYKIPEQLSIHDRVRLHNVGMSVVMLSQGIPFFQAGDDMLRSKSFDRNSYDSGDWFNRLDFGYQSNYFGMGLPRASDNRSSWQYMRPLLANPALRPAQEHILAAVNYFQTLLRIRKSSKLFRLETAQDIQQRLSFYNTGPEQIPGVIVMRLSDELEPKLDATYDNIVVIYNPTPKRQTIYLDELAGDFRLHPELKALDDVVTTSAHYDFNNSFSVPAFTTAVFVEYE
jgi:pullulanase